MIVPMNTNLRAAVVANEIGYLFDPRQVVIAAANENLRFDGSRCGELARGPLAVEQRCRLANGFLGSLRPSLDVAGASVYGSEVRRLRRNPAGQRILQLPSHHPNPLDLPHDAP